MKFKNQVLILLPLLATINPSTAQVSGNATWNENNRFKNNATYNAPVAAGGYEGYDGRADKAAMSMRKQRTTHIDATQNYIPNSGTEYTMSHVSREQNIISGGNEMIINISVLNNATPTSYTAIFHLNQAGKKVAELDSLLQMRVNKFIKMGASMGIKEKDFYLDMIALVPIFQREKKLFSNTYNEIPKGFEMQKNLHVRYKNPEQLDKLFTMAAQCEIYDLIKVEYHCDTIQQANIRIRQKAEEVLKAKISHLKKTGISLDTNFRTVNEFQKQYFPVDQYISYQPLAISAIEDDAPQAPKEGNLTSRPNRTTLFHNAISTNGFDAILNPSPLQPSIQMVYSMEVRYTLVQPVRTVTQTTQQTKVLLITPQGTIKEEYITK
jgi:uncharacterized protein YggE